jgi:hypothetical protein
LPRRHLLSPQGENRKKKTNLAEALQRVESKSQTQRMAIKAEGAPPREDKKMIAGFYPAEVSKQLKLIGVNNGKTIRQISYSLGVSRGRESIPNDQTEIIASYGTSPTSDEIPHRSFSDRRRRSQKKGTLGYMARALALSMLPHSETEISEFTRTNTIRLKKNVFIR